MVSARPSARRASPPIRETLLEASRIAYAIRDAELAAQSALANSRILQSVIGQVDDERLAAIERALQLDDPPDPGRHARLLALQAVELLYGPDFERRLPLTDEAILLARETGDERTLAEVLQRGSIALWSAESLEQRTSLAEEFLECARRVGDPALLFWGQYLELNVGVEAGDLPRADSALGKMQLLADELGQPTLKWIAAWPGAAWATMSDGLSGGEHLAERAYQLGVEAGESDAAVVFGGQLFVIRLYEGRASEIIELLEQSVEAQPMIAAWRAALAAQLCWLGRIDDAAAIVEEAARDCFRHVQPGPPKLGALASYADAAAMVGHQGAASNLYELMEPYAEQFVWNTVVTYGHARMWLGLLSGVLGRHDEADAHLAFASRFHEQNGVPLWLARGEVGWAEALAARGDVARAREHATHALEISREHGYRAIEERAAGLVEAAAGA